jgi:hypothetical protein
MLGALSFALGREGAGSDGDVMRRFALALAVSRDAGDACGILVEHGRYEVCIEVRDNGINNATRGNGGPTRSG